MNKKIEIIANARVSSLASCKDSKCIACEANGICTGCKGKLYAQGKKCVKSCGKGYFKEGDDCVSCNMDGCKKCKTANSCHTCDKDFFKKSYYCVEDCGKD